AVLATLAAIQELIRGALPERRALLWRDRSFPYAELLARSRRAGRALRRLGLGCRRERAGLQPWESGQDHVAIYCYNGNEYVEAMYGAWKARAAFININYRYVADELRWVLATGAARAIVYHAAFAPLLAEVRRALPDLRHFIQVDDGTGTPLLPGAVGYEEWLAAEGDEPIDLPYSADDLYVIFTGGTTGMPKGVL